MSNSKTDELQSKESMSSVVEGEQYCRDSWMPSIKLDHFVPYACAKCFVQVFFDHKPLTMHLPPRPPFHLTHRNDTNLTFPPNPDAPSNNSACTQYLTSKECDTWRQCCQAAQRCCETPEPITEAHRRCTNVGQWAVHPEHGNEVSNYSACFDNKVIAIKINIEILKISLYIDFAGNALSVTFLLAAIVFLTSSRSLRLELKKRISVQLHFSLFIAVLFNGIFTILFHLVYLDAFTNVVNPVHLDNAIWCRLLHTVTKFFKSATFMCMLCEGLYLFRRILNVLQVGLKESLTKYLIIGWVTPFAIVGSYVIVRIALNENEKCWIEENLSHLEFVHIVPNLLSLICNLVFLISIEWMLCTKMRSDTSDKRIEVLRHALRATLSLIPIFGLQFLFIIWRPRYWPPYEIIVAIFTSTQGFLVAVLYCFATQEVKEEMQRIVNTWWRRGSVGGQCSQNVMKMGNLPAKNKTMVSKVRKISCGLFPATCRAFRSRTARRRDSESRGTQMTNAVGSITPPMKSSALLNCEMAIVKKSEETENVTQGVESNEPLLQKHVVQLHPNGRRFSEKTELGLTPIMEVDSSNGSRS
ncbi:hypothetical protein CAPTEDRAFT_221050 [Capitella teleta]|uniref:G-protein coupled receptors family 2 profile 2 domain-containing protein n=1 Tax=Capitella teleta TaxID=283909 RepID=R7UMM7_CAPTE|nr:hypothetical protein CAPTEDRAFT_221050 [Capitella teleta]|eukprot:ELU04502.1 hypothetical protein CAPTEDRAFT_221050 [Capitella teleta]